MALALVVDDLRHGRGHATRVGPAAVHRVPRAELVVWRSPGSRPSPPTPLWTCCPPAAIAGMSHWRRYRLARPRRGSTAGRPGRLELRVIRQGLDPQPQVLAHQAVQRILRVRAVREGTLEGIRDHRSNVGIRGQGDIPMRHQVGDVRQERAVVPTQLAQAPRRQLHPGGESLGRDRARLRPGGLGLQKGVRHLLDLRRIDRLGTETRRPKQEDHKGKDDPRHSPTGLTHDKTSHFLSFLRTDTRASAARYIGQAPMSLKVLCPASLQPEQCLDTPIPVRSPMSYNITPTIPPSTRDRSNSAVPIEPASRPCPTEPLSSLGALFSWVLSALLVNRFARHPDLRPRAHSRCSPQKMFSGR